MQNAQGQPVVITTDDLSIPLEPVVLGKGTHSEAWLQKLIHQHPVLLPVAQIEPGFGKPVAIAMEINCGHGYIDNLFLTPAGDIILVETKLWCNVEARREVVAQALDYAAALASTDYPTFERMVLAALGKPAPPSLYSLIAEHEDALTEPAFVDAVAFNLRRGRMLVMVVGDGIRREAQLLGQLLQSHAGAHFTFALVEVAIWRDPTTGSQLAIPNMLMQTTMIERGIVRIEQGAAVVVPVPIGRVDQTAVSISAEIFDEGLAKRGAALPKLLREFAASLEPLGVYVDQRAALNLKVEVGANKPLNLGYVQKNGQLWVGSGLSVVTDAIKSRYLDTLAQTIGGIVVPGPSVTTNGSSAPFLDALLPAHAEVWRGAITTLIAEARKAAEQGGD